MSCDASSAELRQTVEKLCARGKGILVRGAVLRPRCARAAFSCARGRPQPPCNRTTRRDALPRASPRAQAADESTGTAGKRVRARSPARAQRAPPALPRLRSAAPGSLTDTPPSPTPPPRPQLAGIGLPNTEDNRRALRELLFTAGGVEEHISGVVRALCVLCLLRVCGCVGGGRELLFTAGGVEEHISGVVRPVVAWCVCVCVGGAGGAQQAALGPCLPYVAACPPPDPVRGDAVPGLQQRGPPRGRAHAARHRARHQGAARRVCACGLRSRAALAGCACGLRLRGTALAGCACRLHCRPHRAAGCRPRRSAAGCAAALGERGGRATPAKRPRPAPAPPQVDIGTVPLPGSGRELYTQGLDGLRARADKCGRGGQPYCPKPAHLLHFKAATLMHVCNYVCTNYIRVHSTPPARRYYAAGARFAKWRGVLSIDPAAGLPSAACVRAAADGLAMYARICQVGGCFNLCFNLCCFVPLR